MKLRNKKTGQIGDFKIILDHFECTDLDYVPFYYSLSGLLDEWEDYTSKEPIIKDEKIRKVVRTWSEINNYERCLVRINDYDRAGICIKEAVTSFVSLDTRLPITFFDVDLGINLGIKTERVYTIAELCGEEEE